MFKVTQQTYGGQRSGRGYYKVEDLVLETKFYLRRPYPDRYADLWQYQVSKEEDLGIPLLDEWATIPASFALAVIHLADIQNHAAGIMLKLLSVDKEQANALLNMPEVLAAFERPATQGWPAGLRTLDEGLRA